MTWTQNIPEPVWSWGPAFFLLVGLFVLLRQVLKSPVLVEFVASQRAQASAMQSQAESMKGLAACVEIQQKQGSLDSQEIVIMLKVVRGELADMRKAVTDVGDLKADIAALADKTGEVEENAN